MSNSSTNGKQEAYFRVITTYWNITIITGLEFNGTLTQQKANKKTLMLMLIKISNLVLTSICWKLNISGNLMIKTSYVYRRYLLIFRVNYPGEFQLLFIEQFGILDYLLFMSMWAYFARYVYLFWYLLPNGIQCKI